MSDVRKAIIATYAEWTAMSALRSGAPIKSRRDVYTALRGVDFAVLFASALGPINRAAFDAWHVSAVQKLIEREPRLTVGWATKIINVYLKTRVYIGGQGRHHLKEMIHPPIDAGLWLGLARRFHDRPDILERTNCVNRIKTSMTTRATVESLTAVALQRKRSSASSLRSSNYGQEQNSLHRPNRGWTRRRPRTEKLARWAR